MNPPNTPRTGAGVRDNGATKRPKGPYNTVLLDEKKVLGRLFRKNVVISVKNRVPI